MKKLLTRGVLLVLLCAALALPALADSVTDSISVCIGYFGWAEDEYVEKAKFTWQELDDWYGGALDTHEEFYSYSNGSGRTYLVYARGFYIRDLLDYAGVDVNSIASIDFFTKDHSRVPLVHEICPAGPAALLLPESCRRPGNRRTLRMGRRRRFMGRRLSGRTDAGA